MDRPRALWFAFLGVWSLTLLSFGAVRPGAIAATCLAMAALFGLSLVLLKEPLRLSRWGVAFLAAFVGLFVLQLLPLPFLFPYTARIREAHGVGQLWPGTADTWRTLLFIAQFASYVLAGLLVLKLRHRRRRIRRKWMSEGPSACPPKGAGSLMGSIWLDKRGSYSIRDYRRIPNAMEKDNRDQVVNVAIRRAPLKSPS